jgi:bacterial/archaeal transporter family protein
MKPETTLATNWFFWALLSAFFAGLTAILAKVGVAGINSNLATAIRTSVVLIFTWGIAFATSKPSAILELNRRTWIFLTLSGLATGLSWLCYFRALQLGEASRVAPVDKLSVLFVIAFAALFLHEHLGWQQWLGGLLIFTGALVLAWH